MLSCYLLLQRALVWRSLIYPPQQRKACLRCEMALTTQVNPNKHLNQNRFLSRSIVLRILHHPQPCLRVGAHLSWAKSVGARQNYANPDKFRAELAQDGGSKPKGYGEGQRGRLRSGGSLLLHPWQPHQVAKTPTCISQVALCALFVRAACCLCRGAPTQ
jgi:hypothetical protein